MNNKRRALVLGDESARHPFRQTLPPWIRKPIPAEAVAMPRWHIGIDDLRDFMMAYCAAFLAVSVYIF